MNDCPQAKVKYYATQINWIEHFLVLKLVEALKQVLKEECL